MKSISVLASYPKSGSFWMRKLIFFSTGFFPDDRYGEDSLLSLSGFCSTRDFLVKWHGTSHEFSRLYPNDVIEKVVLLVRDPRDAFFSFYKSYFADIYINFSDFLGQPGLVEEWIEHYMSWKSRKNVYTVKYEDLMQDTPNCFSGVLKFLRLTSCKPMNEVCELSSYRIHWIRIC